MGNGPSLGPQQPTNGVQPLASAWPAAPNAAASSHVVQTVQTVIRTSVNEQPTAYSKHTWSVLDYLATPFRFLWKGMCSAVNSACRILLGRSQVTPVQQTTATTSAPLVQLPEEQQVAAPTIPYQPSSGITLTPQQQEVLNRHTQAIQDNPSFEAAVSGEHDISVHTWARAMRRIRTEPLSDVHHDQFKADYGNGRCDVRIGHETCRLPDITMDDVGNRLRQMLWPLSPLSSFTYSQVDGLRYEIESIATQWLFTVDAATSYAPRSDAFLDAGLLIASEISEEELKAAGKPPRSCYSIEVVDGSKIKITNVHYHPIVQIGEQRTVCGYDAHQVEVVIDLNRITPDGLLATPGAVSVTTAWHGVRPNLSDITF